MEQNLKERHVVFESANTLRKVADEDLKTAVVLMELIEPKLFAEEIKELQDLRVRFRTLARQITDKALANI